jgi:hypothetical protein
MENADAFPTAPTDPTTASGINEEGDHNSSSLKVGTAPGGPT